jgi:hypothetical protein
MSSPHTVLAVVITSQTIGSGVKIPVLVEGRIGGDKVDGAGVHAPQEGQVVAVKQRAVGEVAFWHRARFLWQDSAVNLPRTLPFCKPYRIIPKFFRAAYHLAIMLRNRHCIEFIVTLGVPMGYADCHIVVNRNQAGVKSSFVQHR